MTLTLPTAIVPATERSPKTMVLYGPPKVGKTTMLAALENNLIVDTERGSEYVAALKVSLTNIFEIAQLETLVKAAKNPYAFITTDTIDTLEDWCVMEATRRYKASPQGKTFTGETILHLDKGGGYFHLRNVFYEYFQRLRVLAPRAIFVGHIRDKLLTQPDGKEVSSKDLDLTGKVRNIVCAYADAIGHVYRDAAGKLKLSFVTTDTANCGSRCPHLVGQTFDFEKGKEMETWNKIYLQ